MAHTLSLTLNLAAINNRHAYMHLSTKKISLASLALFSSLFQHSISVPLHHSGLWIFLDVCIRKAYRMYVTFGERDTKRIKSVLFVRSLLTQTHSFFDGYSCSRSLSVIIYICLCCCIFVILSARSNTTVDVY